MTSMMLTSVKHAADHKMKGGKKSAGKKIEKTPKQQA
jgi:hypothetical protein